VIVFLAPVYWDDSLLRGSPFHHAEYEGPRGAGKKNLECGRV